MIRVREGIRLKIYQLDRRMGSASCASIRGGRYEKRGVRDKYLYFSRYDVRGVAVLEPEARN